MKTKYTIYIFYYVLLIIVFGLAAEITLRALGRYPWKPPQVDIRVEPGGKFCTKDLLLGYSHLPGKFRVTLNNNYVFNVTHLANTLRITHPLNSYDNIVSKPEIWIFGCSITHGWSLNDEDTYPWILQEKLPDYEIVNFGVTGYGTLHTLIQLKEAIKNKKPYLAVITYSALIHDERNTFLRKRRKAIASWNKLGPLIQPYARLDYNKKLYYSMAKVEYSEFPLMRYSSLANYIEGKLDTIEERFCHSHEVSKAIIKEISILCKIHNVKLIVAAINSDPQTEDMLKYCENEGILTTDISVDYSLPENTNLPIDGHPSAVANKKIANKLYVFLKNNVLGN